MEDGKKKKGLPTWVIVLIVAVSPNEGIANALADLNGDGTPELSMQTRVSCTAGRCTAEATTGATQ